MAEVGSRSFYGGEPLMGATGGEISTGKYDGPEAHEHAPWKCPACGVQNEGPIPLGCVHCGSGKPGRHIGQPPPPEVERRPGSGRLHGRPLDDNGAIQWDPPPAAGIGTPAELHPAYAIACAWAEQHHLTDPAGAFLAGYDFALRLSKRAADLEAEQTPAPVETLAPHTKAQRTIIAALEIFKDQILSQGPEEITSGEWCSASEVDELIARLQAQL
jgi:hypothetical protein